MARQYAFMPQVADPRETAQQHWDDMRNELNVCRDALDHSEADRVTQAALIDMLRKELADAKAAHDIDQVALTVMRTRLKAAGMLVLDALKDSPPPEHKPKPALQDLPKVVSPEDNRPRQDDAAEDDGAANVVQSIRRLDNKWP